MAAVVIPTAPNVPNYVQRTTLDGREYSLAFRWSMREARWYLDLLDAREQRLAVGIKLVVNYPLLSSRRFSDRLPPGELLVVDGTDAPTDPGLAQLGDSHTLFYIPVADLGGAGG